MDFDNIPAIKPFQEVILSETREKESKIKKEIIDFDKNNIDSYLSSKFIKEYFTLSNTK